jgi:hypothetical protein
MLFRTDLVVHGIQDNRDDFSVEPCSKNPISMIGTW